MLLASGDLMDADSLPLVLMGCRHGLDGGHECHNSGDWEQHDCTVKIAVGQTTEQRELEGWIRHP